MKVYFDQIEHGKGNRSIYLYASLYNADTNELIVNANMEYCLAAITSRNYVIVRNPLAARLKAELLTKMAPQQAEEFMAPIYKDLK